MSKDLSWNKAIRAVLQDATEPMSGQEIVDKIVERGLHPSTGATPAATVRAQIYTSIKNDGEDSPFELPAPGRFALKSSGQLSTDSHGTLVAIKKVQIEDAEQGISVINALGMFWERSKVNWKSSQPKLLGLQPGGTVPVDFCCQRGVYLLHDHQGVVYVGRTTDQNIGKRLHYHLGDRLNGRWDRFSWFGVYPVSGEGKLKTDADLSNPSQDAIISAMEAILIEALEPRQNRKRGDGDFDTIEYLQVEDPDFESDRKKAIINELAKKL
jgi:hypothetical protein